MKINSKGGLIEIIPIQTGTVAVKQKFIDARFKNFLSKPDFLLDKIFTNHLPIWLWVIKHPEGIFVIDTGENSKVNDKDYFDKVGFFTKWVNRTQFKFEVEPNQEVGEQLKRLGITKDKIKKVILTHLHIDHFDGLHDFEGVEIVINKLEWEKPSFSIPELFPKWLKPTLVTTDKTISGGFNAFPLTDSNDLFLIHTPGHTIGHCSVLLCGTDLSVIFAGDVVYTQEQIQNNAFAGVNQNFKIAKNTYAVLKSFMSIQPTIFLPSHDPNSANRLKEMEIF
ncbi:MAG: N-acyl homoserine lactonase family protein [Flavobacteriaceae bacterium]|nr:N-acyl homoserine lactonase family protein [Flavobacteriaceae bacterium]